MAGDLLRLGLLVGSSGTQKTVAELLAIQAALKKTADEAPGVSRLATVLGTNFKAARQLADQSGRTAEELADMVEELRRLDAVGADAATQFAVLSQRFNATEEQIEQLANATRQYGIAAAQGQQSSLNWGGGLGELAFRFNNVIQLLQTLQATAGPVYQFLIGSNERLNQQLLSSQTNLASATRIFQNGAEITDPTERINASRTALEAALKQIEVDTQSLVGVTSQQVNELFQITLTNAAALNNQSKQFPDPIAAASELTKGWAASLKVVGVPLDQARQEINSILKGTIDQESILAKNLNLTNAQVKEWQSQGVLVDKLNGLLGTFVAGNAIAARSVEGISSNIQDLFERLGRNAGEPLLEPIVAALAQVEAFLKANEAAFTDFFGQIAEGGVEAVEGIAEFRAPQFKQIFSLVEEGVPLVQNLFTLAINGVQTLEPGLKAIQDVLIGLVEITKVTIQGLTALSELALLRQINDAQSALDNLRGSSNALADEAIRTATALKALNDQQRQGIPLTADQQRQFEALTAQGGGVIAAIDAQIKAYEEINAVSPEVRQNRDAEVAGLERLKAALAGTTGEIQIQAKELPNLGTSAEQLKKKVEDAQRAIETEGSGDTARFQDAAKQLIELTQQQVELGQITEAEAQKQLQSIADNAKVELEVQTSARQQIVALRKAGMDAEISAIQAGQAEIEALQAQGRLGEAEAEQQLTALKIQEIQKRIQANRAEQQNAFGSNRAELVAQERELQAELDQVQAEAVTRKRQRDQEAIETQIATIKAGQSEIAALQAQGRISEAEADQQLTELKLQEIQKRIEANKLEQQSAQGSDRTELVAQERELQAQLSQVRTEFRKRAEARLLGELQKANEQAERAIANSQNARIAAVKQAQIAALQQQGADAVAIQQQTEQQIQAIQLSGISQRIQTEQQALEQLRQSGLDSEQAKQQEAALIQSIAQLNQQRLDAELQAIEQARAARVAALEEEFELSRQNLDLRAEALALENQALDQSQNLLSAQAGLQQAITSLVEQRLQFALEDAKAAGDLNKAAQIQAQLSAEQAQNLERQYQQKLATLAITERQKANDLEIARVQSEINALQAEEALLKAQSNGASERELELLQRSLELKRQAAGLATKAIQDQAEINLLTRQQAEVERQAQQESQQRQAQQAQRQIQEQIQAQRTETQRQIQEQIQAQRTETQPAQQTSYRQTIGPTRIGGRTETESTGLDRLGQAAEGATKALEQVSKTGEQASTSLEEVSGRRVPARRDGGPVAAGMPYLVGEAGPELVVPRQNGYVMTAAETAAMMAPAPRFSAAAAPTTDQGALLREVKALRADLLKTRPQQNNSFTLVNEQDPLGSMVKLSGDLLRQQLRMGGL